MRKLVNRANLTALFPTPLPFGNAHHPRARIISKNGSDVCIREEGVTRQSTGTEWETHIERNVLVLAVCLVCSCLGSQKKPPV